MDQEAGINTTVQEKMKRIYERFGTVLFVRVVRSLSFLRLKVLSPVQRKLHTYARVSSIYV